MWKLDRDASPAHWRLDPAAPGVRAAFSTRRGGVSGAPYDTVNLGRSTADRPENVAENRARLLAALGLDRERLAIAGQVHGAVVARAERAGIVSGCDALVTREPNLVLAITSADCLPILFIAPGAVAAAHAGWRGAAAGVAENTLKALCETAGAGPDRVEVHFGPCIRDCCYTVGPEVAALFPSSAVRDVQGERRLSIPAALRTRLVEAGLGPGAIYDTEACTACEPALYFSHRRDRGLTGRQWGLIARTSA